MINKVIDIVRRASSLMMTGDFEIKQKGSVENLVTSSDLAVQEFLCKEFSELIPGCGFICEEEGKIDREKEYVWVIDPIDGTANYARGLMNCCISVGLMRKEKLILGVVYSPARQQLFHAERGKGAFLNGRPIKTSSRPFESGMFFCALSLYNPQFTEKCSEIILDVYRQSNDVRRYGSAALEICLVAAGEAELHFEMKLLPWDYAGASVILEEAGGVITSLDGKAPSMYGADMTIAANNKENHERLLSIVRKHLAERPF